MLIEPKSVRHSGSMIILGCALDLSNLTSIDTNILKYCIESTTLEMGHLLSVNLLYVKYSIPEKVQVFERQIGKSVEIDSSNVS